MEREVGLSFWLRLGITGAVGIVALLEASYARGYTGSTIAFLIFLAAIAYGFWLIKTGFDRIDQTRH